MLELQESLTKKSMILHNRLFSIFYDSEDIYKPTARRLCRWRQQYSWNYVNTSQSYGEQTFNLKVSNTLDLIPELLVSLSFLPIQPVLLSQLNLGQVWSRLQFQRSKQSMKSKIFRKAWEGGAWMYIWKTGSISVMMINFEILYTIILDHVLRCSKQASYYPPYNVIQS